jgi:hypothetical protein
MAEVYFIHYNGKGPEKIEESWVAPMPDGYMLKVAYPKFQLRHYSVAYGEILLQDQEAGNRYSERTELMEDIDSIARMSLKNRLGRIKAKAIARATAKYLATAAGAKAVADNNSTYGAALSILVKTAGNIASAMSEQADTRHWRFLPAQIRVGRILLPPGMYSGQIEFVDENGNTLYSRDIRTFKIKAGQKHFVSYRTLN